MFKLNEAKVFYDMAEGMAIVIDFTTGIYYGTNVLGSEILDRLVKGSDLKSILTAVKALPGCPEDIENRLSAFVRSLLEHEIIVMGEVKEGNDAPFDPQVASEGFDLYVDEFADMQELIQADPVHEVDPEVGWTMMKEGV